MARYRVIVCGGRNYGNGPHLWRMMDSILVMYPGMTLVHGGASGADALAGSWAKTRQVPIEVFPADWKRYGPKAGPIRNQAMLDRGADAVVAFPGGLGTADMMRRALAAKIAIVKGTDDT